MTLIVTDENSLKIITAMQADGFPPGCAEDGRFRSEPIGTYSAVYADEFPLIPESEVIERIKYVTANQGFIGQRWQPDPRAHFQSTFGWCWAYSLTQAVEGVRAGQGLPFVQLAPESLLELVNYRNQGYYCDRALEYAKQHGIAERALVPQYSQNPVKWGDYRENAKQYVPLETWDCTQKEMRAQVRTALLCGDGVYGGWDKYRHAMWLDGMLLDGNKIRYHTPNTHGPGKDWALDSEPDEAFILRSATYNG